MRGHAGTAIMYVTGHVPTFGSCSDRVRVFSAPLYPVTGQCLPPGDTGCDAATLSSLGSFGTCQPVAQQQQIQPAAR
jgi:hypothetical protein